MRKSTSTLPATAAIKIAVAIALALTAPAIVASETDGFEFDASTSRLQGMRDVSTLITPGLTTANLRGRWAKVYKRLTRGDVEPTIVIITTNDASEFVREMIDAAPKSVGIISIRLLQDAAPEIVEHEPNNVYDLTLSQRSIEDSLRKNLTTVESYLGIYVFGQHGRFVCRSADESEADVAETLLIARTLTAASRLRRALSSANKSQFHLSSDVMKLLRTSAGEKKHTLSDVIDPHGRAMLLNVWATWCPSCKLELPELVKLQSEYKSVMQYVGLLTDTLDPNILTKVDAVVPPSLRSVQFGLLDNTDVVRFFPEFKKRHVANLDVPLFVLITPDGQVRFKRTGNILAPSTMAELRMALDKLKVTPK